MSHRRFRRFKKSGYKNIYCQLERRTDHGVMWNTTIYEGK